MTIIKINGTQIVHRVHNGKEHRRNSSHVKKYWTMKETQRLEEDDGSIIDVPSQQDATTRQQTTTSMNNLRKPHQPKGSHHPTATTANA